MRECGGVCGRVRPGVRFRFRLLFLGFHVFFLRLLVRLFLLFGLNVALHAWQADHVWLAALADGHDNRIKHAVRAVV